NLQLAKDSSVPTLQQTIEVFKQSRKRTASASENGVQQGPAKRLAKANSSSSESDSDSEHNSKIMGFAVSRHSHMGWFVDDSTDCTRYMERNSLSFITL